MLSGFGQIFKTPEKSISRTDTFANTVGENIFQPERHQQGRSISSISSNFKMRLSMMHESKKMSIFHKALKNKRSVWKNEFEENSCKKYECWEKSKIWRDFMPFRCKNTTIVVSLSEAARKISINKGAFHLK